MNREQTLEQVRDLGAWDQRPAITAQQVERAVDGARIRDSQGLVSGQVGYVETYDVNAAVAHVYRIKAGLVAGDFTFTADNGSFSKADVLAHMLDMEALYAARSGSASGVGASAGGTLNTAANTANSLDELAARLIP